MHEQEAAGRNSEQRRDIVEIIKARLEAKVRSLKHDRCSSSFTLRKDEKGWEARGKARREKE